jgi:orotate phosphoribosyltransferase-like protein
MIDAQLQWQRRERACEMRRAGMSCKVIAEELGISQPRVSQLVSHLPKPKKERTQGPRPDDVIARERMRIGRRLLSFFPPLMTAREAAEIMGDSRANIERLEKLTAYKIAMAMRRELNHESHLR